MNTNKDQNSSAGKIVIFVLVCFFLSGLTGLVYEILWTRMIVKLIGGAPFAVSIILTIFMAGLGVGSLLAGKFVDKLKTPASLIKTYGLLELIIGIYGLIIQPLLLAAEPLYAYLYNHLFGHFITYNLFTFVGCALLLLIPVLCMGATLPILCRFYITRLSHLATHAGRLYGLNTAGAAVGALLCGFWLIDLFGIWGALILVVAINCLIGLACLAIGSFSKIIKTEIEHQPPIQQSQADLTEANDYSKAVTPALVIFAVSGFCAMAYEVIWTKLLTLIVGPTTYSFTIVLFTFILALAFGSMVFGFFADKTDKPITLLIATQITAALFALLISQLLGNSQFFFAKLIYTFQHNFAALNFLKALVLFAFMALPAVCLGATFPLVGKIYIRSMSKVGRSIGFAYMINSFGAVLGSFCAGFVLLPFLGKELSLSFIVCLQLLVALFAALVISFRTNNKLAKGVLIIIPVVLGILLCFHFPQWNRHQLSVGKYQRFEKFTMDLQRSGWLKALVKGPDILKKHDKGEVVFYSDGIGGFTTVVKYPNPISDHSYSLVISGKPDASSKGDMKTQVFSAHFPMLFHPKPEKVMVLGLASGITAGEVLHYPVQQLDVLDINQQVVAASDFFLPWNNKVLSDPKTNLIIQDGRAHLQLTDQEYDVIISEPSNPWMAGLAALFTHDFFSLAENKLKTEGIFVQFLHSYQMNWETFALVGRTFNDVFPNSILVSTEPYGYGNDYLLVGFKTNGPLELQNAVNNLRFAQGSKNMTLLDHRLFYKMIVSEDLTATFGPGPLNSDNYPRLEFAAPRLMYLDNSALIENLRKQSFLTAQTKKITEEIDKNIDSQIDFAAYALSVKVPSSGMVDLKRSTSSQRARFVKLMEQYCAKETIDFQILSDDKILQRCLDVQIDITTDKITNDPDNIMLHSSLADLLLSRGDIEKAIDTYSKVLQYEPENANVLYDLGVAFGKKKMPHESVKYLKKALAIDPGLDAKVYKKSANVFARNGLFAEAVEEFKNYLKIHPNDYQIHNELGVTFARLGDIDQAIQHLTKALAINPNDAMAQKNLRILQAQKAASDKTPQKTNSLQ